MSGEYTFSLPLHRVEADIYTDTDPMTPRHSMRIQSQVASTHIRDWRFVRAAAHLVTLMPN
jgi:hypothetical protein